MSSRRAGAGKSARSISCTDEDYAQIRARARRAGQSMSDYVVERGLTVNLSRSVVRAAPSGPRLVLDEQAQREMHTALSNISRHAKDADWLGELRKEVRLVVQAAMLDMLWQGRRAELRSLLAHELREPRASELAERMEVRAQEQGWVP